MSKQQAAIPIWLYFSAVASGVMVVLLYLFLIEYFCPGFSWVTCQEEIIAGAIFIGIFLLSIILTIASFIWIVVQKLLFKKNVDRALRVFLWLLIYVCTNVATMSLFFWYLSFRW